MRISFILPGAGREPVGGVKIVYEYANRLTARGHDVTLIHTVGLETHPSLSQRLDILNRYLKRRIRGDYGPAKWFDLHPRVSLLWVHTPSARVVPAGDVVIATSWQTAEWVAGYPVSKGRPFYFIQHKEVWSGPGHRVMATWKLPLEKIVISRWLEQVAGELGEKAIYVPNGLDFDAFGMDTPPDSRNPNRIMMLYHRDEWKGSEEGLKALSIVRESLPELEAVLFGVPDAASDFPEWVQYYRSPAQSRLRELYNEAAVFLAPSRSEGWGLPGSEAMMCGAAVVATDIGGHREFARADETALMVPARDYREMARQLLRMCRDDSLRNRIAKTGHDFIQQFTWERAVDGIESALDMDR